MSPANAAAVRERTGRTAQSAMILERSVCLVLNRHYLGNNRRVKTGDVVQSAGGDKRKVDDKQVTSTKKLVDNTVLRPAMRVLQDAQEYLRLNAISAHRVFGDRTYLLPIVQIQKVDEELKKFQDKLAVEAEIIAQKYEDAIEAQRLRLNGLFNRSEYPTVEEARLAWSIDWDYVSFSAPERLETVDRALFESARSKYEKKMGDAYAEVRLVLRDALMQVTAEIVKKLKPGPMGESKTFKGTILDDLHAFLGTYAFRNITDDKELTAIVNRLKSVTKGVTPESIREGDDLRAQVLAQMKAATDSLAKMVVPTRRTLSLDSVFG